MMLHKSFKPAKCKTALNLAKSRIKLMKNKKDIQFRQLKREVAQLLQNGQDQTARIRVEHVIREEKMMAAYEMIEIYCELTVARLPIIESQKTCPLDLKEAITSLIFAAPRCGDIPELQDVRKHFSAKYGKEFVTAAVEIRPQCGVSRVLVEKLSAKAPDGPTKVKILKGIAEEHNIQWEPNWFKDEDPLSSSETLQKISHAETSTKIQMEPLNAQFADDHDDQHLETEKSETFPHVHAHANTTTGQPSSSSRSNSRPSEGMLLSQSSGSEENVSSSGMQHLNMEFKDATAAALAAAESAERASMAARAAADFAGRGNIVSDSAYEPTHSFGRSEGDKHYLGSVLHNKHDQGNPITSSFNQRSPRMRGDQRDSNKRGSMTGRNDRDANKDDAQAEVRQDIRQHDLGDSGTSSYLVNSDNRKQSKGSASILSNSRAEYNLSESSNFQDYESEPAENPFHEETVEQRNRPSNLHSQSIHFDDAYDPFADLNSRIDKNASDDGLSAFNQGTFDGDDWHARTDYRSKFNNSTEEMVFKDQGQRNKFLDSDETKYLFDSSSAVSADVDQRIRGVDIEKRVSPNGAEIVFDDYGSDVDDCILDHSQGNISSGKSSPERSSVHHENRSFEPDLSESFRKTSLYSQLIKPVPVFDDFDGSSSESEKDLKTENAEPGSAGYYSRKLDRVSGDNTGLIRRSSVEGGSIESFTGIKHIEENQSIDVDSVDEDMVQEHPTRLGASLKSHDHESKFDSEARSSPQDGIELNLGSLPGGRRNRSNWVPSYTNTIGGLADVSSPSRSSRAAAGDAFGANVGSSTTYGSLVSSGETVNKQVSNQYYSHGDDSERQYSGSVRVNQSKPRTKDPTGYFEADDSCSEEDVPKPVTSKNLLGGGKNPLGAGISRRTKKDSTRSVASSQPSTGLGDTGRTRQFSTSSHDTEAFKKQSETTSSSSTSIRQSIWDNEASTHPRIAARASKTKNSSSPIVAEKPVTPVAAEIPRVSVTSVKPPSRENSGKTPSHVHPKLPDFEALTAHLESIRTNRK